MGVPVRNLSRDTFIHSLPSNGPFILENHRALSVSDERNLIGQTFAVKLVKRLVRSPSK